MSDFKAKMHQIPFPLGLRWGAYNAPKTYLKGLTSKEGGKGKE